MPKYQKTDIKTLKNKLKSAWQEMTMPLKLCFGGVLLLAAILFGGILTAYGGTLLVILMWVICTASLWGLLQTTWKICFPDEPLKSDKPFLRCWSIGSAVGVLLIASVVYYRQTIYGQDAVNYYAKQNLLFGSFTANGFYGVHQLAENLLTADYKMFINLFVSIPYLFTTRSINAFMVCYALACFVPAWFAWLAVAKKLREMLEKTPQNDTKRTTWYYALCMAVMMLWPMFLQPATNGMPDFFGMVFVAVILLLTAEYRFETLPLPRLFSLYAATFALVLTRRWYMYWIVSYYALYAVAVLIARRKVWRHTLGNMFRFGIPAVLGIVLPLFLTFKTILTTDYADIYGAYYGGGFWENVRSQIGTQGLLWLLLCLLGFAAALCSRRVRWQVLVVVASSILAMGLFTRTQSLGYHQSLILAPMFFVLLFCLAGVAVSPLIPKWQAVACLILAELALNSFASLGLVNTGIVFTNVRLDLVRRTDLPQLKVLTDFVAKNCTTEDTVYINLNSHGYSGSAIAYSDTSKPELQSIILYENSVPSTHGFPTGIWSSKYVFVTDEMSDDLIGRINTALRTDTPAAAHYSYVGEFPLDGVTLYCYERTTPPDDAEAEYFKALFADYNAQWPWMFDDVIDNYMSENAA